jgi:hypothetical protein
MSGISRFDLELDRWIAEVDELAAQLMNEGYEPWAAQVEATRRVKKRRADERLARIAKRGNSWRKKISSSH